MASTASKGKCAACQQEFTKRTITTHLKKCAARNLAETSPADSPAQKKPPVKLFHLLVEGRRAPMYWLHLEMPSDTTLTQLDSFLRKTWLECCGHLSAFTINGEQYSGSIEPGWGMGEKSMGRVKLSKVVSVGQQFEHEYDFGTTTELKLKVVSEREGQPTKKEPIQILAQNDPPELNCECGKPATQICLECSYDEEFGLCEDCAEEHECGEEMLLPVVNSPRMGQCAYGA